MNPLLEELTKRGLMSQTFGNLEEILSKPQTFYIGIDPTADSLGVHHMVGLMAARIMQSYGHKPIILVGGATCAIGDPSGKSEERKAISMETVFSNVEKVKTQIAKIINFDSKEENGAVMLNNYEWYKDYKFLDFIRDVGKKITVNYLMAKENVRKRLERDGSGISFQEFSYGLLQGYDFVYLYNNMGCRIQIGGTDNLGNIVTGRDLIHKMLGKDDVCGITWDLVTCADGRKFGKTEGNSVWLDPEKTTPYEFYQFWINQSDVDSESFIKKFTLIPLDECEKLIAEHRQDPSKRILQNALAKYMTTLVHSEADYEQAVKATQILFGKSTSEDLVTLDESTINGIMKGVNTQNVSLEQLDNGMTALEIACLHDKVPSKSEARKLIKSNGFLVNKQRVSDEKMIITRKNLIKDKYLLLQKGKKEYTFVVAN